MKVLIVKTYSSNKGGVASYYNSILPHLMCNNHISVLEIGKKKKTKIPINIIMDQIRFNQKCKTHLIVHLNPSLRIKSIIRDAVFSYKASKSKSKLIVFFHGWNDRLDKVITKCFKDLFKITYGKADAMIVLSNRFKERLVEWGYRNKIYTETTAVDDSLINGFSLSDRLNKKPNDTINILVLSRIEKKKGIIKTIDALSILKNKGLKIKLNIAGDGAMLNYIVKYVNDKKLNNCVKFYGYIKGKEKASALIESDIFCLPSSSEGMPTALLEAMSFGLPIIATGVGGIKDIYKNIKFGILLDEAHPSIIAKSVNEIIKNRIKYREYSKKQLYIC